jgi:hypothetical protein
MKSSSQAIWNPFRGGDFSFQPITYWLSIPLTFVEWLSLGLESKSDCFDRPLKLSLPIFQIADDCGPHFGGKAVRLWIDHVQSSQRTAHSVNGGRSSWVRLNYLPLNQNSFSPICDLSWLVTSRIYGFGTVRLCHWSGASSRQRRAREMIDGLTRKDDDFRICRSSVPDYSAYNHWNHWIRTVGPNCRISQNPATIHTSCRIPIVHFVSHSLRQLDLCERLSVSMTQVSLIDFVASQPGPDYRWHLCICASQLAFCRHLHRLIREIWHAEWTIASWD